MLSFLGNLVIRIIYPYICTGKFKNKALSLSLSLTHIQAPCTVQTGFLSTVKSICRHLSRAKSAFFFARDISSEKKKRFLLEIGA